MVLCFSLTNLSLGGAQVFVTRLASYISKTQQEKVFIYDHWPEFRHQGLVEKLHPGVVLVSYCESSVMRWFIWKFNALLQYSGLVKTYRHNLNKRRFMKFLQQQGITLLNSHMSYSDFLISGMELPPDCNFVISTHGEYEMLLTDHSPKEYYRDKICKALLRSLALIYTAEKNLNPVHQCKTLPLLQRKINPGFDAGAFTVKNVTRGSLGLHASDFVIGMISRGIPEKGWDLALAIAAEYKSRFQGNVKMLLIGDGDYLKDLVKKKANADVIHIDFGEKFQDYFSYYALFDLFLFPSRFRGESVPNVIIESLYWKVPVLSTHHAEIPEMIGAGTSRPAGICIDFAPEPELVRQFSAAINDLVGNRSKLKQLAGNCAEKFERFEMKQVAQEYLSFFNAVLKSRQES